MSPIAAGLLSICLSVWWVLSAPAATITFNAANLADTTPGQDLWQYSYTVSGVTFGNGEGFSISFDRTLFTSL